MLDTQITFDPSFAAPSDWADMYRAAGIQVVPAPFPMRTRNDKRPALADWKQFQAELAPDAIHRKWFPDAAKPNMGMITGAASGGIVCIDLDDYKGGEAAAWFHDATMGVDPETWSQITGGGGRQFFYRMPPGETVRNCKTGIGVDVRGWGGFAMLPPSHHLSGGRYRWVDGRAPWEIDADTAPPHLIRAIRALIEEHGGGGSDRVSTTAPAHDVTAFGRTIDGREDKMARMIWARLIDLRRDAPMIGGKDMAQEAEIAWHVYERSTATRIAGVANADGLEMEGRGLTAFMAKWQYAAAKWDGDIAEEAAKLPPFSVSGNSAGNLAEKFAPAELHNLTSAKKVITAAPLEFLDVRQIKALADPQWLVAGLVPEKCLGFVFGPPGCGKSFIAIGMALSVACGIGEWWGRKIQRNGPVVYVSSEGQSDLKFRIRAWEDSTGHKADDAPFYLIRQSINFLNPTDVAALLATVEAIANVTGELPAIVFVDTVSRVLPGADENLQKDMTVFIAACDAVRQKYEATVIGVHHTSRAGNLRGSTVFDGAGDFLARIEREEGEMIGTLTAAKVKAAEDGWQQSFEMRKVDLGLGHSSLYAAHADAKPAERQGSGWPELDVCRLILALVATRARGPSPLSPAAITQNQGRYFPHVIAHEFSLKVKLAEEMMRQWLNAGVLGVAEIDKKTKRRGLVVTGEIGAVKPMA